MPLGSLEVHIAMTCIILVYGWRGAIVGELFSYNCYDIGDDAGQSREFG